MFDLTRSQRKPYLQEEDMPVAFSIACHVVMRKAWAATEKGFGCLVWLYSRRAAGSKGSQGQQDRREVAKWWTENGLANCFTILRRITKLKCVNSEVRSVHIYLKKGSLKWVHGTMSEPPWKSH